MEKVWVPVVVGIYINQTSGLDPQFNPVPGQRLSSGSGVLGVAPTVVKVLAPFTAVSGLEHSSPGTMFENATGESHNTVVAIIVFFIFITFFASILHCLIWVVLQPLTMPQLSQKVEKNLFEKAFK